MNGDEVTSSDAVGTPTQHRERAILFTCCGEQLAGILTLPSVPAKVAVLIVTGGPQYRAGSHRQFVLLARRLGSEGYAALRFDHRGSGDATGASRTFEAIDDDIDAAVNVLCTNCPTVQCVVLWGLCDAASALLGYWAAKRDSRVGGMIVVNPWVRSAATLARTQVKYYYPQRLRDPSFWKKLARGDVDVGAAIAGAARQLFTTVRRGGQRQTAATSFQDRMANALRTFPGPILLLLSGRDYTAREFSEYASVHETWRGVLDRSNIVRTDLPDADHTFSRATWRREVEDHTIALLKKLRESM